jgi:LmbE family N-acetylglucosaminyl deacetylase
MLSLAWALSVPGVLAPVGGLEAQISLDRGLVGNGLELRTLDGEKRVLLVGAHPDDEDTALLTALARGMGAKTAYLSLTRGDGGQNLIGPELGEGLGVIRTGELLAARELDGGRQFFTRAFDYGFSKSADEAFGKWPREALLRDVVWVVRSFRPHVIVSIFSGTPADGHGQHQAAGILAAEAFEAAADPDRFPEMAALGVEPWQVGKLYRRPRGDDGTHTLETGRFDPLLGRSHFQLAMESRSQHRSQDMGVAQPPGGRTTELLLVQAAPGIDPTDPGFFAGIDTTLIAGVEVLDAASRRAVEEGVARYRIGLERAAEAMDPAQPWGSANSLAEGLASLREAEAVARRAAPGSELARILSRRTEAAEGALLGAAGVTLNVVSADDLVVPGGEVELEVQLWNGGEARIRNAVPRLVLPEGWSAEEVAIEGGDRGMMGFFGRGVEGTQLTADGDLVPGALARWRYRVRIPGDAEVSDLYFREVPRDGEMYRWPDDRPELWGLPKDPPTLAGGVDFTLATTAQALPVSAEAPARYVGVDKATGQFEKPVLVVPAVWVAADPGSMVWPAGSDEVRQVRVRLTGQAEDGVAGQLRLEAPEGWQVTPAAQPFDLRTPGAEITATFQLRARDVTPGRHTFRAVAEADDGRSFDEGVTLIDYPHIERTAMVDPATLQVSVFQVAAAPVEVGYLMGSGDDGMRALEQMGVSVREVTPAEIASGVPGDLDVLVLGIRVYETRPEVAGINDRILDFARSGGTVVVQYNKYEYPAGGFAPYPVSMGPPAPRVTDEGSPVEILDPDSPVIDGPNLITEADFEGWVQERGLYFLDDWDDPFEPVLAFTDPGEEPALGSLLVAPVGEGRYVYTGISFFRQFPAGVPGAHRLFANLISLGAEGSTPISDPER